MYRGKKSYAGSEAAGSLLACFGYPVEIHIECPVLEPRWYEGVRKGLDALTA
jgi:hypothetical protein